MNTSPPTRNRRWLFILGFAVCILLCVILFPRRGAGPGPVSLPEVPRAQLTLRDGCFYQAGANVPFTGFVTERYPGGGLKCRSVVSNGLLEGLSAGWHTNGQQQVEEYFHAGISHGHRTKWHENGSKQSEADIAEGKIQGLFRRWHDNGRLAEEITMNNGEPEGLSRAYYPNGQIKAEVELRHGEVVKRQYWDEAGKVAAPQANPVLAQSPGPPKP